MMRPSMRAAALGAVVGSRSLLVPALMSGTTRRTRAARVLWPLAAMELVADKTAWIPPRTAPVSLAARVLVAAAVGYRTAPSMRRWRRGSNVLARLGPALVAAAAAVASASLLRALRARAVARSRASNTLGGLAEDLLALAVGRALTR
jgi:uncharacterized membrane protein